jgi:hypothetical protein
MTQVIEQNVPETSADSDLVVAVQKALEASPEPLTPPKIRAQLPARFRTSNLEAVLHRQVAARVLHQYPKYRSQQDRFWHQPMPVHLAALLRATLQEGPLAASELRRKLPAYAQPHLDAVLEEQLKQGQLHRHPRAGRTGEKVGLRPPDAKDYLRSELEEVFSRLEQLGFSRGQIRASALELLHDEEWASPPKPAATPEPAKPAREPARQEGASSGTTTAGGPRSQHEPHREAHAPGSAATSPTEAPRGEERSSHP